ncbi:hypothetical protein BKA63DRAFT_37734 [Paraphoma chrysanthemicola]|nr:hypothetical protein BKA63DRAFT_37734 [Paraphoma chrysanthemicola]
MMITNPPAATVLISTVVHNVARDFLSLADALLHSEHFANQISPTAVSDELSRFKLWAGNIAAHRRGRRSLEHRLRDADSLRCAVHDVLKDLVTALLNSLAIVKGDKTPWDEAEFSDSESDTSTDNLQGQTELKQLLASIATFVTSLFRLSMAIRDPAPSTQSTRTISADKSYFEPHDILHVQAKFPGAADYLGERLGRAISARRQYLSYREEHHKRLAKHIEKIEFEEPKTEHTSNSTEATSMPQIDRQNSPPILEEDDGASQTSFAPSLNAPIRAPSMPKKAQDLEFYECPLCFTIISIHERYMWKQHVFRDLHPYSCTFPHCTTADRLYESRHEWFQHELGAHRMAWECVEGCGKVFDTQQSFDEHVHMSHSDLIDVLPALERTSVRGADLAEQVQCLLCAKSMSLRALQKHMALHQQQLALFALPPSLDETEDDHNDSVDNDAQSSQDIDNSDKMSDASYTREADKSPNLKIPWWIHTQKNSWHMMDDDVQYSTTRQPPSIALQDHDIWTEVWAAWVSEEAIAEAGYSYNRLRHEPWPAGRLRGPRFAIEQALTYPQVRQLVQRTREILMQQKDIQPVSTDQLQDAGIVAAEVVQPRISEHDARATSALADEKHSRSNEEQALDVDPPYAFADLADSQPRFWPGMHQHTAALANARRQAEMQSKLSASVSKESVSTPARPPQSAIRDEVDGRLFEVEMVRSVRAMPKGERILPPCDRCRRLHMDCVKNFTACLGCSKKHATCSWREMQGIELTNSNVYSESLDSESGHLASTASPTATFGPRYDTDEPSPHPFRIVGHTAQQIPNSPHLQERTRQNSVESSAAATSDPSWDQKSSNFAELGRAEGRGKERSEILLAEKERQRAVEREEARRREQQEREDEAAKERRKERTRVLARNSSSSRPTQTRRLSKTLTVAEVEEQRRLLAMDAGQLQGESMLAEAPNREGRSALLRQQQQYPSYYDPRGGGIPGKPLGSAKGEKPVITIDSSTPFADFIEWWERSPEDNSSRRPADDGVGSPPPQPVMARNNRENVPGQTNRGVKRASNMRSLFPESASSQSDRKPEASPSDRTTISSNMDHEIRLRMHNESAAFSFQAEMEGRTLRSVPTEDGMADTDNARGDEASDHSEQQGHIMDDIRSPPIARQGRREADEASEGFTRTRVSRRDRVEQEARDDQEGRRQALRRGRDVTYH